jgi:hypothetical protein
MEFHVQLPSWSAGFEILSIQHNQITQLVYWRILRILDLVLPEYSGGFLNSLTAELMTTCHPLNSVPEGRISQGFCNNAVSSRVVPMIRKECCHHEHGMEGVVVGIFCHHQHCFPIISFVVEIVSQITLKCLVYPVHSSVSLTVKG